MRNVRKLAMRLCLECHYADLVYKFRRIVGYSDFSQQFKKINISPYQKVGYNMNVMQ